jgi:hypothetical protein
VSDGALGCKNCEAGKNQYYNPYGIVIFCGWSHFCIWLSREIIAALSDAIAKIKVNPKMFEPPPMRNGAHVSDDTKAPHLSFPSNQSAMRLRLRLTWVERLFDFRPYFSRVLSNGFSLLFCLKQCLCLLGIITALKAPSNSSGEPHKNDELQVFEDFFAVCSISTANSTRVPDIYCYNLTMYCSTGLGNRGLAFQR